MNPRAHLYISEETTQLIDQNLSLAAEMTIFIVSVLLRLGHLFSCVCVCSLVSDSLQPHGL